MHPTGFLLANVATSQVVNCPQLQLPAAAQQLSTAIAHRQFRQVAVGQAAAELGGERGPLHSQLRRQFGAALAVAADPSARHAYTAEVQLAPSGRIICGGTPGAAAAATGLPVWGWELAQDQCKGAGAVHRVVYSCSNYMQACE